MARILLVLVLVLLLLNGMTFLLVVNQGGVPEKSASAAPASASRSPSGPDPHTQKLEQVSQSLQGVQKSITDLARKVDDLQRKVQLNSARSAPPSTTSNTAPTTASSSVPPAKQGQPKTPARIVPTVRKGPTEISNVGNARAAQPESDPEEEDDNAADHAPPRRLIEAPVSRTPGGANGNGAAGEAPGSEAGAGTEGQPAPPVENGGAVQPEGGENAPVQNP